MRCPRFLLLHTLLLVPLAFVSLHAFAAAATPAGEQKSDKEPDKVWTDDRFGFQMRRVDDRYWSFKGPDSDSAAMRVQLDHTIGGKKDFIRFQVYAWETKTMSTTEALHLERWKTEVKKLFGEITEDSTREKDRFGKYPTMSYTAYGRLASDKTEIRRVTAHVFKTKRCMYTIVIIHEPDMDKKYADDLKFIEKNFRAK